MLGANARAGVYRRLATMEKAGISLRQSLDRLSEQGGAAGELLRPVRGRLEAGKDAAEAFVGAPGFSAFEGRLIAAGARSGNLPDTFEALAETMEARVRLRRGLFLALAYPLFLMHLAVFLPTLRILFQPKGGLIPYLLATAVPLGAVYLLVGVSVVLLLSWRSKDPVRVDGLLIRIPVLGGVLRDRALASALRVLRLSYGSGITLATALEATAEACPNRALADMFARARPRVAAGEPLSAALADARDLPADVLDMITSGETAGELAELLEKSEQALTASADHRTRLLMGALTTGAFLLAALLVAVQVIAGFMSYVNTINELGR